jgi:hypothetical protein
MDPRLDLLLSFIFMVLIIVVGIDDEWRSYKIIKENKCQIKKKIKKNLSI